MHLLQQNKKSNKRYKKYLDNQWHEADCVEEGYYIWKNENGIAYCKEKAPYDGNGNPFLNRSLNDSNFKVRK
jgi:hypothetical protein